MTSIPLVSVRKMSTIAASKTSLAEGLQAGRTALRFNYVITVDPKDDRDHGADVLLVVDNKDTGHGNNSRIHIINWFNSTATCAKAVWVGEVKPTLPIAYSESLSKLSKL